MTTLPRLVASALLLGSVLLAASPPPRALAPEALGGSDFWPSAGGAQFVGADRAGRVTFFRASDLSLLPLRPNGSFAVPAKLDATTEAVDHPMQASLSLAGDRWFLRTADSLRLFVGGKETLLPQPEWQPWSIGFVGNTPVTAVIPLRVHRAAIASSGQAVPWLLAFEGSKWSPLVYHDLRADQIEAEALNRYIARQAVVLASGRDGKLWIGNQYFYQLRRFSAAGKPLLTLTVGNGKTIEAKTGSAGPLPKGAHAFTAAPIIRGLVEGRDGRLYILVSPAEDGKLVLDRYDGTGVIERVLLTKMPSPPGLFTLAAGKDGLYLAPTTSRGGRWRLGWDALEKAPWLEVKDVDVRAGATRLD